MREWLLQGFDYDLWANLAWVECLPRFKDRSAPDRVMGHVLGAQRIWLDRINDQVKPWEAYASITADKPSLAETNAAFKRWLADAELEKSKPFQRFDGTRAVYALGDVARHVLNHGTYHRGHLRGLAEAEGLEDFEDTDFVLWLRTTGQAELQS